MEENNVSTEVIAETDIAGFDDGWGDEAATVTETGEDEGMTETEESAEATADQPEENADTTPQAEAQDAGEPEETEAAAGDGEKKDETKPFKLKYLGKEVEVNSEEIVTLAQKGMDYDRQRNAHDKLKGDIEALGGMDRLRDNEDFLKELAALSGVSVEEAKDELRVSLLMKKENITKEAARQRVELQKREKRLTAKEAKLSEDEAEKTAQKKRDDEFSAFLDKYPTVKGEDIPKEVWDAFRNGESLLAAYEKHLTKKELEEARAEIQRLRSEAETARKNADNRRKSTGSMKGAGDKPAAADPFDDGWN